MKTQLHAFASLRQAGIIFAAVVFYICHLTSYKLFSQTIYLSEGFESVTFPPVGWTLTNPDTFITWQRTTAVSGFGNSTASAKMDFYNYQPWTLYDGAIDYFDSPAINFSGAASPLLLKFNVAYAQYSGLYSDRLIVRISTDGGSTWGSPLYNKAGAVLATAPQQTSAFTPASSQWRNETVDISSYTGQSNVKIRFETENDGGNNLYLDDILIDGPTDVNEPLASGLEFQIFPNPGSGKFIIKNAKSEIKNIEIHNVFGEKVYEQAISAQGTANSNSPNGLSLISVNLSKVPNGIYFLNIKTDNEVFTQKLIMQK